MQKIGSPKYQSAYTRSRPTPLESDITTIDRQATGKTTLAFLTYQEFIKVILLSVMFSLLLAASLDEWGVLALLGFMGFFLPIVHFCYAGNYTMAFPLFLPIIFGFQHVVSSLYCSQHPFYLLKGDAVLRHLSDYLPIAVSAEWGMYLGVLLPLSRAKPIVTWHKEMFSTTLKKHYFVRILVVTFWLSILIGFLGPSLSSLVRGTGFLWLLLAKVSYVSVIGLGIIGSRKYRMLLLVLAAVEIRNALDSTLFHSLIFFVVIMSCLLVFTNRRRRPLKILWLILILSFSVYSLQCIKGDYRQRTAATWGADSLFVQAELFVDSIFNFLTSPSDMFSERNLGFSMSRFDQGQIVNMVMDFIPNVQPYKEGETVIEALNSVVGFRAVSEEKYAAGGSNFFRFTGIPLPEETSRNLGQLGEFYGNFGPLLSVVACFFYALFLGYLWKFFHEQSLRNPIWLAWFPFLAMQLIRTEDGLGEVMNYTAKAALVAFLIVKFVPEWKNLLGFKGRILGPKRESVPSR